MFIFTVFTYTATFSAACKTGTAKPEQKGTVKVLLRTVSQKYL